MSKLYGIAAFLGVTGAGILWFYVLMYNWLWLGLVNSTTTGWLAGYMILFLIFIVISIAVTALLIIGYICSAIMLME